MSKAESVLSCCPGTLLGDPAHQMSSEQARVVFSMGGRCQTALKA